MRATAIVISAAATIMMSGTQVMAQSAEEAATACNEAARLIAEDDLVGALDEAKWCVESLQQLRQQATLTVFPDAVEGFAGGEIDNQSAMGMTIIERQYTKEGEDVTVSLTTGMAGGGLAALAQLGMGMGAGSGKKIRVQKRTVLDMSEAGGDAQFMVQLKSGGMLNISSSDLNAEQLLPFVKAFPIADLDDALEP
ncbi:hypothetical protein ACUNV4_24845 [Granulosicoccus sp. 3-233]|uniref:hypothetical protein n=1 Tax=Granulosicoccus sp. 3-233 TaxID=3417969 RepID=UPI003D347FFA